MTIKARPNTHEFEQNYDNTFKDKVEKEEIVQYWECWSRMDKRTARFTSLKDAQEYATKYPRDVEYGIKLPDGTWIHYPITNKPSY